MYKISSVYCVILGAYGDIVIQVLIVLELHAIIYPNIEVL